MTKQQGVTYFAVDVVDTNGFTWRLLRRYSHFSRFQALMNNYETHLQIGGRPFHTCLFSKTYTLIYFYLPANFSDDKTEVVHDMTRFV